MHESLDCASEKVMYNVLNTLAHSFLIGSSSFLQVTRTTVKLSLSVWKNPHRLIMGEIL